MSRVLHAAGLAAIFVVIPAAISHAAPPLAFGPVTTIPGDPPRIDDGAPQVFADFDGDGLVDTVAPQHDGSLISFGGRTQTQRVPIDARAVDIADFNGDGKPDLLGHGILAPVVVEGLGASGDPAAPAQFGNTRSLHYGAKIDDAVGWDVTGDGVDDVFIFDPNGADAAVIAGGAAFFVTPPAPVGVARSLALNVPVTAFATADFDADGHRDLAVQQPGPFGDVVTVSIGDGAGGFTAGPTISFPAAGSKLRLGDINGDGLVDVSDGTEHWALNLGQLPPADVPEASFALLFSLSAAVTIGGCVAGRTVRRRLAYDRRPAGEHEFSS